MMSSYFFLTYIYMLPMTLQFTSGQKLQIQAFPSNVILKGSNVTIRCSSQYNQGPFSLLRINATLLTALDSNTYEQDFTVTNVQEHNSTDYYCYQYYERKWRDYSDFLTLQVIDPEKPNISACEQDEPEDHLLITCSAPQPPQECIIQRYFLYSGKTQLNIWPVITITPQKKIFKVSDLTAEYRCSYLLQVKTQLLHLMESPLSDRLTTTKCEDSGIIADYTTTNRVRLTLAFLLIVLACGFVIEYWISSTKNSDYIFTVLSEVTKVCRRCFRINGDPVMEFEYQNV
ncbi:leukocyte immunoglobulin-like receptor subfamily A member 5 [Anomaloglossus baeobatrachus]|uniref:leukocyte immunoglobulin-like receptor subfamily A member 5 n=1 Tax=Anomaloglossus baeobatrachus TaxID=238106 RepID=UPI003F502799